MENPVEQGIQTIFLNFVIQLSKDAKEHPEEWASTTITDYLERMASWLDDCYIFEDEINWEKADYKTMAKIYEQGPK